MNDSRFARVLLAIGPAAFERLQMARVAVVGLGGVGGFAMEALARSGIGTLRIIDVDTVQRSNINRQIIALESTLGSPKVDAAATRLRDINPSIQVEAHQEFFHSDTADRLLNARLDFVIDAIDAVLPKTELICYCYNNRIPIISVMGAAFKQDYSRVKITDISKTTICPLARVIRRRLGRRNIRSGITVVYSDESGVVTQDPADITNPDLGTLTSQGRPRRILGSFGPMIGVFGLLAAHHVIQSILAKPNHKIQ